MPQHCRGISGRISKGVFGAIALSLTFGAAQLALGRDLGRDLSGQDFAADAQDRLQSAFQDPLQDPAQQSPSMSDIAINRAAKSDRAAGVVGSPAPTRTISLRPQGGASDSSILIRIPMAQARSGSSAPAVIRSGDRKMAVACEPMVSVLTEAARLMLQPGRCVT
jgi:hypothetical protein